MSRGHPTVPLDAAGQTLKDPFGPAVGAVEAFSAACSPSRFRETKRWCPVPINTFRGLPLSAGNYFAFQEKVLFVDHRVAGALQSFAPDLLKRAHGFELRNRASSLQVRRQRINPTLE